MEKAMFVKVLKAVRLAQGHAEDRNMKEIGISTVDVVWNPNDKEYYQMTDYMGEARKALNNLVRMGLLRKVQIDAEFANANVKAWKWEVSARKMNKYFLTEKAEQYIKNLKSRAA